jgi:hypothetical protein
MLVSLSYTISVSIVAICVVLQAPSNSTVNAFVQTSSVQLNRQLQFSCLCQINEKSDVNPFEYHVGMSIHESRRQVLSRAGIMISMAGVVPLMDAPSAHAAETKVGRESCNFAFAQQWTLFVRYGYNKHV